MAIDRLTTSNRATVAAPGFVVQNASTDDVTTAPSVTSGTGVPTASEANGSLYQQTDASGSVTLWARTGGAWVPMGGTLYASSTVATVTNTVSTEQYFGNTYTLPASALIAGKRLRIRWHGEVTASAGTDTLTVKVYVGSTAFVTTAAVDTSANDKFQGEFTLLASAAPGASVACYAAGYYTDPAGSTAKLVNNGNGGSTLATNATLLIRVSATWSATTATNTATLDILAVDLV